MDKEHYLRNGIKAPLLQVARYNVIKKRKLYTDWHNSKRPSYEDWLRDILDYLQYEELRVCQERLEQEERGSEGERQR